MAQAKFDRLLEQVLAELPDHIYRLLDEMPLVVEDEPSIDLLEELGLDPDTDDLCGLYSGQPLTERSNQQANCQTKSRFSAARSSVWPRARARTSKAKSGSPCCTKSAITSAWMKTSSKRLGMRERESDFFTGCVVASRKKRD
jgi:hypothetical protein